MSAWSATLGDMPTPHAHAWVTAALYLGQRSATAGVMDDVGDDTTDVVVALRIVHEAVPGSTLAVGVVGPEHRPTTLPLRPNDATHSAAAGRWREQLCQLHGGTPARGDGCCGCGATLLNPLAARASVLKPCTHRQACRCQRLLLPGGRRHCGIFTLCACLHSTAAWPEGLQYAPAFTLRVAG